MRIIRIVAAVLVAASLAPGPIAADSAVSGKHAKPVHVQKQCRKEFRRATADLQVTMDATIATWDGAKRSAETAIADMKQTIASPDQNVSLDALKSSALISAKSFAQMIEDEGDRNLEDAKAYKKKYVKCFATSRGKDRFGNAAKFVHSGFYEMKMAKYSIWEVWMSLSAGDVAGADKNLQLTLANVIGAEPTFDQGMQRLADLD